MPCSTSTAFEIVHLGVISFNVPKLELILSIAFWIFAAGGVFILIDVLLEDHSMKHVSTAIGLALLVLGLVAILNNFGVISIPVPAINNMVFYALFVVEGLFLMIGAFAM